MRLDAERLEHIPSGWNQPDGICPVIQDGPVRVKAQQGRPCDEDDQRLNALTSVCTRKSSAPTGKAVILLDQLLVSV
jgi:hypothetical protein